MLRLKIFNIQVFLCICFNIAEVVVLKGVISIILIKGSAFIEGISTIILMQIFKIPLANGFPCIAYFNQH